MKYKTISKLKLFGSLVVINSGLFASNAMAQYSTLNPSMHDQSSIATQVKDSTETFLYNLKPKFKSNPQFGFDDFRVKYIQGNSDSAETTVSFLTSNTNQSICNIHIVVQPDGRIFNNIPSNTPSIFSSVLALNSTEISTLNNFKLSSLLLGCGLDTQQSPFGNSKNEANFRVINEFYKNGQVFSKTVEANGNTINAIFPSYYLLYRNNFADLLASSFYLKNNPEQNYQPLFGKYHSITKLHSMIARQSKGIPVTETFNSYDIALKDGYFNNISEQSEKSLEDKAKTASHESVMMTYLLGQRVQTESIMDIQTIKQSAIVRVIQELNKDFNPRTSETGFNKHQNGTNNLSMKIAKLTVDHIRNSTPSISGYNNRLSSSHPNNTSVIVNYIDKLISDQKLDKLASIEYENMRKNYPAEVESSLSKVNTVGFYTHQDDKLKNIYQNIYDEYITYTK